MTSVDPITIVIVVLVVALVMLLIGGVAFRWGWDVGFRDGAQEARKATRPAHRRTLGAMWRDDWDWRAETQPHERVRGWTDDDADR